MLNAVLLSLLALSLNACAPAGSGDPKFLANNGWKKTDYACANIACAESVATTFVVSAPVYTGTIEQHTFSAGKCTASITFTTPDVNYAGTYLINSAALVPNSGPYTQSLDCSKLNRSGTYTAKGTVILCDGAGQNCERYN